eukprot:Colp12_sorted_trinity150504_noHs@6247
MWIHADVETIENASKWPQSKAGECLDRSENAAFFSIISSASDNLKGGKFVECLQYAQVAVDHCWEKLYAYEWKDVPIGWRKYYAFSALLKAISASQLQRFGDALKACDLGLLMGVSILDNALSVFATELTHEINKTCTFPIEPVPPQRRKYPINPMLGIPRVSCPSLEEFLSEYVALREPVIITDAMEYWPAMTTRSWSDLSNLRKIAGPRTVPVELGSRYTDDN